MENQNEAGYRTDQRNSLAECLERNKERLMTAADIAADLARHDCKVALATIYRNLESLEKQGTIHKFVCENGKTACWQYIGGQSKCTEHYHLKCERCGKIIHLECGTARDFEEHIMSRHNFSMNRAHTLLYGTCGECIQREGQSGERHGQA